ncbi:MAG: hypothetical protein B6241_13740 [Spirochaetaceae bacterium 4572_59]|nr:MAG: hypothetical protein B6241_13740 [Spirochaetaceae bacterium 4572_59]
MRKDLPRLEEMGLIIRKLRRTSIGRRDYKTFERKSINRGF